MTSIVEHHIQLRGVRVVEDDPLSDAETAAGDARAHGDRDVSPTKDEGASCNREPRVAKVDSSYWVKGAAHDQRRVTGTYV